jgi:hypothetical protein
MVQARIATTAKESAGKITASVPTRPSEGPFFAPEETTAIVPRRIVPIKGKRGINQSGKYVIAYPFISE